MLDIAVAYNRYKFLGNEFLTWLWFMIATDHDTLRKWYPDFKDLSVGNRMVLENSRNDNKETITIKGDNVDLGEGIMALQKGALVTEIHLVFDAGELQWQFSIKGESFGISNLKLPETGPLETSEDLEGAMLETIYLLEKVTSLVDTLFARFIKLRVSSKWRDNTVPRIRKWTTS